MMQCKHSKSTGLF